MDFIFKIQDLGVLFLHTIHIPVMAFAFTIDTLIKIACYGINSAISIIEDNFVEVMRKYYYQQNNEPYKPYKPIENTDENYRSRRLINY